jgi:triosephosphate isomerase
MKRPLIVANWKANMTINQIQEWFVAMMPFEDKDIVICPPFHHLSLVKSYLADGHLPFKIGSQDVSEFEVGADTGEEPAALLKEVVEYAIIGHSERRKLLNETEDMLIKKVSQARMNNITPIFCIQDEKTPIPDGVTIVAYEPVFAIGTGIPDTPENAEQIAKSVKANGKITHVLYGGSVTAENVKHFTAMENIDGVLVGKASLTPDTFIPLIKAS